MNTITDCQIELDPGSRKFDCPSCRQKRLVRYIDNQTGNYLPEEYGRCDREISCGYHRKPDSNHYDAGSALYAPPRRKIQKYKRPSLLPMKMVDRTLCRYDQNPLIRWMATLPGWSMEIAVQAARRYKTGTGRNGVDGWSIFWQIDQKNRVRSGKIMNYDTTGHRVKEGYSQDWVHSKLQKSGKLKEYNLKQCLFGLHLIHESNKPIAIVEAEKTAIIASVYFPQFTWMACGFLRGLQPYKFTPLRGRSITLFPDGGGYDIWLEKAKELGIPEKKVSRILEDDPEATSKGHDLADYLIKHSINRFTPIVEPSSQKDNALEAEFKRVKKMDPIINDIERIFDAKLIQ